MPLGHRHDGATHHLDNAYSRPSDDPPTDGDLRLDSEDLSAGSLLSSLVRGQAGRRRGGSGGFNADFLSAALEDVEEANVPDDTDTTGLALATGGVLATAGYVLLNTRTGYWMLSLLSSRPLWKDFDALEVVYAWENEAVEDVPDQEEDCETLLSIVDETETPKD